MKRITLALTLIAVCSCITLAAREPVEAQVPWVLKFEHKSPKRVAITDPVKGKVPFWYVSYTVTNPFDDAKMFLPEFEIRPSGHDTVKDNQYPKAQELAEKRDGKNYLSCVDIRGLIKPGETKSGIAIFRQIHRDTNRFTLVAEGFSATKVIIDGETATTKTKVYKGDYFWPGDRFHFDPEYFTLTKWKWEDATHKISLKAPLVPLDKE